MTKQAQKALKSVGIPAVRWSDAYGQFYARIGYNRTKHGMRGRAVKYLGRDEQDAIAKAVVLKAEWKALKREHGTGAVWGQPSPVSQADVEAFHAEQTEHAIESGEVEWQTPLYRLEQVRDLYGDYRKAKGIAKPKTLASDAINLRNAVAAYNPTIAMSDLRYPQLEEWRDALLRREKAGHITKRTFNNYIYAIKRLLDWCHRTPTIAYRHAEDVQVLFAKLRNANPTQIAEYDADSMRTLLLKANDRTRLYIYLGLNLGAYQGDIASLKCSEVQTYDGKACVIRKRNKTSHQNDFEAMHTLWPETVKLLKQEWADKNEWGLALLNGNGQVLKRQGYDGISKAYDALRNKFAGPSLPSFKQLRKIGATAIQRIGGDEARRLYKAGAVGEGDRVYVRDSYEKLTPHLLAWGDELRGDGVLF